MQLLECLHDPGESFPSFGAPSPISGEPAEEEYPLISRIPAQKSTVSGVYTKRWTTSAFSSRYLYFW